MKPKRLPLKTFKYIYSRVPRLCVDLVIKNSEGILLTKRDIPPKKGYWHFPGGTVLMGETLKDAVQRVAEEELSTKVKIKKLLGFLEYTDGSSIGLPIAAVFLVRPLSKVVGGKQARNVDYFSVTPEKTLPEVKRFIKRNLYH
jgi:ADP-ribose pyrophosphatase YjhB (NUDIX family)